MKSAPSKNEKLAIDGGTPVRRSPLPLEFPGIHYMDEEEVDAAVRVLRSRSPFRYYGVDVQGEVQAFETEFASFLGIKSLFSDKQRHRRTTLRPCGPRGRAGAGNHCTGVFVGIRGGSRRQPWGDPSPGGYRRHVLPGSRCSGGENHAPNRRNYRSSYERSASRYRSNQ